MILNGYVTFHKNEAVALVDLIDMLSGGNARNVFSNDGRDSLKNVTTKACAKLYLAAGREILVPEHLLSSETVLRSE